MDAILSTRIWVCRCRIWLALASAAIAGLAWAQWGVRQGGGFPLGVRHVPMAPSTSLLFLLANIGLVLQVKRPRSIQPGIWEQAASAIVFIASVLLLAAHYTHTGWTFENWLAATRETIDGIPIGRMAPLTMWAFLLTAAAGWLERPSLRTALGGYLAGSLSLTVWLIGLVVFIGYIFGTPLQYGSDTIPMSFAAALAFLFLGLGLWLPHGVRWWNSWLLGDEYLLKFSQDHQQFERWLLGGFILVGGAAGLVGYVTLKNLQQEIKGRTYNELNAVADLKAEQIMRWREDCLREANLVARIPAFSQDLSRYIADSASPQARHAMERWLALMMSGTNYEQVVVFDEISKTQLASTPWRVSPGTDLPSQLAAVRESRQTWMGDVYRDDGGAHIDLLCPVIHADDDKPIAVVLFRIDPRQHLYPLLRNWPGPSSTSEAVLVRRENQDVLYLNPLRHMPDAAFRLRRPLNSPDLPAANALRGQSGLIIGNDYRGIPVLAVFRPIPDTSWVLGAKMDQSEVYTAMRSQSFLISLTLGTLLLATLSGTMLLGRWHYAGFLKRELLSERGRKELAERLASVTRYANDSIIVADANCRIVEANERALKTYGYKLEEMRNLKLPDLRSGETRDRFALDLEQLKARTHSMIETVHVRKDGSEFPVEVSATMLNFGGIPHTLGIVRDISDRKRYEHRLQQLIAAIQKLARSRDMPQIMAILRSAARHLTEADGATFVLRDGAQCFYADEDAISPLWKGKRFPMSQCISGWVMLHNQAVAIPDIFNDPRIPVEAYQPTFVKSMAMVPIGTGQAVGAIGNYWKSYYSPTQEEMQLLQTLADAAAISLENANLYSELERRVQERTAQLEAANQELESFSYSISHDLRAPLRALSGLVNILATEHANELAAEGAKVLKMISEESIRMGQLVYDLLEFSRQSRLPISTSEIDMVSLALAVLDTHSESIQARQIRIVLAPLLPGFGDFILIRQVFVNLLSNAIKYTLPIAEAAIEIGCFVLAETHVYFVKDNGVGFDMNYAQKLFGVFQRLHRPEEFEGTGVGLALVKHIVNRHGGQVWVEARVNQGAVFYFSLPNRQALHV